MTNHKWHDEIVAWAGGAEIEYYSNAAGIWVIDYRPQWDDEGFQFRIKPQPEEPKYLYVYAYKGEYSFGTDRLEECDYDGVFIGKIEVQP